MSTTPMLLKIDGKRIADCLQEAREKLDAAPGEAVLDFSSVLRIDARSLATMEELADLADDRGIKIGLAGVNVGIYKVLKLDRLATRFSFRH